VYLKTFISFSEKRTDVVAVEKKWMVNQSRLGTNDFELTPEKSIKVFRELILLAQNPRFDFYSLITDLRLEKTRERLEKTILEGTLSDQIKCLIETLSRFTRTPHLGPVRKSRGSILQCDLKIVSKSITGLYETERKL